MLVESFASIILFLIAMIFTCAGLGYFARQKNYIESKQTPYSIYNWRI